MVMIYVLSFAGVRVLIRIRDTLRTVARIKNTIERSRTAKERNITTTTTTTAAVAITIIRVVLLAR